LRPALLTLLLASLPALAGTGGLGWRHDGTGHFAGATPPASWSAEQGVAWKTALPAWSNASPVLVAGKVCASSEPTTLLCADAATGRILWKAANDVVDALPAAEQPAVRAELATAPALEAELAQLRRDYAAKRRDARGGTDVLAELERIADRMGDVRTALEAVAPYRTPPTDAIIGWSSPSPVTDGRSIYAFYANGVVSRYEPDGRRTWSVWLGRHTRELKGYLGLPTASPRLAGGVLVVGYEDLVGLDPATGKVRWRVADFRDYGTPAVADVGGLEVVLTGDGRAIRARDGVVLATGLGDLWYTGPVVAGDRAYWAGTTSAEGTGATWPTLARAYRLARAGDTIVPTKLWEAKLPSRSRHYATPLVWGDRLVTVARDGDLAVLDTATGAVRKALRLASPVPGEVWTSPMEVGGRLVVQFDQGHVLFLDDDLRTLSTSWLDRGLATPIFEGSKVYVRGRGALFAVTR
jgi:outer membrane protein assembly factor BamB